VLDHVRQTQPAHETTAWRIGNPGKKTDLDLHFVLKPDGEIGGRVTTRAALAQQTIAFETHVFAFYSHLPAGRPGPSRVFMVLAHR
jgi:hypothetical protein